MRIAHDLCFSVRLATAAAAVLVVTTAAAKDNNQNDYPKAAVITVTSETHTLHPLSDLLKYYQSQQQSLFESPQPQPDLPEPLLQQQQTIIKRRIIQRHELLPHPNPIAYTSRLKIFNSFDFII